MLLEMKNITKLFGPVRALNQVDFTVNASEIHGLLGENGAGKSTLMNILAGAISATEGEIYIDGELVEDMTISKSNDLGIRFIHQELNLFNDLTVFENLFLGQEIKRKNGFLDKKQMIERSKQVLDRMKMDIDPLMLVDDLEPSRKQLLEIAKALLFESDLIIMDEPTTALTNKEIEILFSIMRQLKEEGISIIFISHKMPELFSICDKYTVLRDGNFIDSGYFKDIDENIATKLLVGRNIVNERMKVEDYRGDVVFSVKDLTCDGFFEDVSFDLRKGEVLAITGLHGDGRGELSEALFGARHLDKGEIIMDGNPLKLNSIKEVMRAGIGMVPRNRKERSIIKDLSILNNVSIAYFITKHRKVFISRREEVARYERNKKITDIKTDHPDNYITSLSGGNQQKVVLSRWLELDSDVYILDNPTQGIDVGAKFEIYKLIDEIAKRGKSVVVFSSEFPEIYKIADRCLVMYKGQVNAELNLDEMTDMNVMYYATGSNMETTNGKSNG